jgi:RNA polymerase sigma-70 factor, ECF subfamily
MVLVSIVIPSCSHFGSIFKGLAMCDGDKTDRPQFNAPDSTSSSLIRKAKTLQPEAWHRLVELYGPLIYHWCRTSKLKPEDAKDVSQEVLQTVAAKIIGFRHDRTGDTFRGWLRTITRNKIGDHIRRHNNQPQAKGGSDAHAKLNEIADIELPSTTSYEKVSEEDLLSQRAMELVRSEFEERTWQAFWRVTAEEQPPAAVAKELGMTLPAVYKAKSRVLCRLRQELDDTIT